MEYSKWARQKNKNILTEPKEGLKIEGGGAVQSIIAGLMYYEIGFASNSAKISGLITNQPGNGGGALPSGSAGPILLDR